MANVPNPQVYKQATPSTVIGAMVTGLFPHTERGAVTGKITAAPSQASRGRHMVVRTEPLNVNARPTVRLWTDGDSTLPSKQFDAASVTQLVGPVDKDLPDGMSIPQHVAMTDPIGRAPVSAGGYGAIPSTIGPNGSSGTQPMGVITARDDGGSFTLNPTEPVRAAPVNGDAYYVGASQMFQAFRTAGSTPPTGVWTIVWEYWNGGSWVALPNLTDGSSGLTAHGAITYSLPDDWATTTIDPGGINQGPLFFLRGRMTGFVSIVTVGSADQAVVGAKAFQLATPNTSVLGPSGGFFGSLAHDAYYWGFERPLEDLWVTLTSGAYTGGAFVWEIWNGSTWTTITPDADPTSDFSAASATYKIEFPRDGTWLTRDLNTLNTAGNFNLFWLRWRVTTAPTGITTPNQASVGNSYEIQSSVAMDTSSLAPAAFFIPEDPNVTAPYVTSWGIPLPRNLGGDSTQIHTYWDPIRKVRSRRFAIANNVHPPHGDPNVTKIAQWTDATAAATLVGTFDVDTIGTSINADDLDATIVAGEEGGPPMTVNETLSAAARMADAIESTTDSSAIYAFSTYRSTAYHRDRAWCGGSPVEGFSSRLVYSAKGLTQQFPIANFEDVDGDDGDFIVALRAMRDVLVVFKRESIHFVMGEPGAGNLQIKRVADIGTVAMRSCIVIGNLCYFMSQQGLMSIDGSGKLAVQSYTEDIRSLVRGLESDRLENAVGIYDHDEDTYMVSVPGLAPNLVDGPTTTPVLNDAVIAYHIPTGSLGVYDQFDAISFANMSASPQTSEVWVGDYHGRVWRMTDDTEEGQVVGGVTYSGNATGGTANTMSGAGWLNGASDRRIVGLGVQIVRGVGAGQIRKITASTTTLLSVAPNWDVQPDSSSVYRIGSLRWLWESGDYDLGAPEIEKHIDSARVHLANSLVDNDLNPIDFAKDSTPLADTTVAMVFAGSTVETGLNPQAVRLPEAKGYTQRIRIQGLMTDERVEITALTMTVKGMGKARG